MALTTSQKIDLFRILKTSYTGSVSKPEGEFDLSYREHEPGSTSQKLQTRILNRLEALDADEENWLIQRLNSWQLIGINSARIDGSIGGVNGVTYDPIEQKEDIRSDILTLIPVYEYQEELEIDREKRNAGFSSCAIR